MLKKKLINGMISAVHNYCIILLIHNNDQYNNNSGYTLQTIIAFLNGSII